MNFILMTIAVCIAIVCFGLAVFMINRKSPILKVILSGYISISIIFIGIVLTSISVHSTSDYIDITTIYFILGFASFVLYFVFFNKRT